MPIWQISVCSARLPIQIDRDRGESWVACGKGHSLLMVSRVVWGEQKALEPESEVLVIAEGFTCSFAFASSC